MSNLDYSREVAFSQSVINIGSDNGNDIILRGDNIGDFHAMLHFDSDRWYITQLDPTKPTTINGRQIGLIDENLQNGSVLGIGDYRLTLMLNGLSTDIMIQYQGMGVSGASAQYQSGNGNIMLEITSSSMTEIEAGATTEFELTVTNAGPLVANMQLQLQGIPSSWVQIIPPVLNLNEGRKGLFTVRINPPRDPSSEAGYYNLHFIAASPNYQGETGIVDSSLTILPFTEYMVVGPTHRRLEISRRKQSDLADIVILNKGNAATTFFHRSYDDANELYFTYEREGSSLQGQESVTVRPGDNSRVPLRISSRKLPLFGFSSHSHHYNTDVTPADRPGEGQSVMGEVVVKPLINTFWVFIALIILLLCGLVVLQPRIFRFDGDLTGITASAHW